MITDGTFSEPEPRLNQASTPLEIATCTKLSDKRHMGQRQLAKGQRGCQFHACTHGACMATFTRKPLAARRASPWSHFFSVVCCIFLKETAVVTLEPLHPQQLSNLVVVGSMLLLCCSLSIRILAISKMTSFMPFRRELQRTPAQFNTAVTVMD